MTRDLSLLLTLLSLTFAAGCASENGHESAFASEWESLPDRVWTGADYWANPLEDWQLRDGRLENVAAGGDRNVFLLTREVADRAGDLELGVRLGPLEATTAAPGEGWVGFRVGIRGALGDYRDSAVRGVGLDVGVATEDGRLFIGTLEENAPAVPVSSSELELVFRAEPAGEGIHAVLEARDHDQEPVASIERTDLDPAWLTGGLALVSSSGTVRETPGPAPALVETGWSGKEGTQRGGAVRFWFRRWRVSGSRIDAHPERSWGPILFTMHTLDRGRLRLTAQLAPIDAEDPLVLEVQSDSGWTETARAAIEPDSRTATFSVEDWDATHDVPYRVVHTDTRGERSTYEGTVRRDPIEKGELVVAAFTGNNDLGFPHADVVRNVRHLDPDFLAFTGDQIYERVGEYGIVRAPVETAILDYLRKWYLFGWEYGELLRDIPSVALPDDHDVYHGNIWGAGGRASSPPGREGQDKGGYTMPARFVRAVERTQTSHLPVSPDPRPVEQGIGVYFTSILYGGVSFAVIEDRKWKSAPTVTVPAGEIVNGWPQAVGYDAARDGDVPGAQLLGERQEEFLEEWSADWSGNAWMKIAISQTLFANVATLPRGAKSGAVIPTLPVMAPGEYAEGELQVADHDSNGWPQKPRDRALRSLRKGFALHIAGDQHLGSTIQYGIDEYRDASWALCVPSVANVWPRRWYPPEPGAGHEPGMPRYTGDYLDGFGNRMTVHAVSNPSLVGIEPTAINHRAPGFGLVTLERSTRKITLTNWPRWVDTSAQDATPYPGWPLSLHQLDNGYPREGPSLGEITRDVGAPLDRPVLQVIDEAGAIVYTVRLQALPFAPRVRRPGRYTVRLFDPDGDWETAVERTAGGAL